MGMQVKLLAAGLPKSTANPGSAAICEIGEICG
jgi:hypothetical protein